MIFLTFVIPLCIAYFYLIYKNFCIFLNGAFYAVIDTLPYIWVCVCSFGRSCVRLINFLTNIICLLIYFTRRFFLLFPLILKTISDFWVHVSDLGHYWLGIDSAPTDNGLVYSEVTSSSYDTNLQSFANPLNSPYFLRARHPSISRVDNNYTLRSSSNSRNDYSEALWSSTPPHAHEREFSAWPTVRFEGSEPPVPALIARRRSSCNTSRDHQPTVNHAHSGFPVRPILKPTHGARPPPARSSSRSRSSHCDAERQHYYENEPEYDNIYGEEEELAAHSVANSFGCSSVGARAAAAGGRSRSNSRSRASSRGDSRRSRNGQHAARGTQRAQQRPACARRMNVEWVLRSGRSYSVAARNYCIPFFLLILCGVRLRIVGICQLNFVTLFTEQWGL